MQYKYPRTYHLPYSASMTDDDKRLSSDEHFKEFEEVVVTIKMDGENTTCYPDGRLHARSLDGNKHEWQSLLKSSIWQWCYKIPTGWRVCGENLYARHSIAYSFETERELFQVFGIYDDKNSCISWNQTVEMCKLLDLKIVHEIYRGKYDKKKILDVFSKYCSLTNGEVEGFVIRNANAFRYEDFARNVGKYVRKNHVQTDDHWTEHWTRNKIVSKNLDF